MVASLFGYFSITTQAALPIFRLFAKKSFAEPALPLTFKGSKKNLCRCLICFHWIHLLLKVV